MDAVEDIVIPVIVTGRKYAKTCEVLVMGAFTADQEQAALQDMAWRLLDLDCLTLYGEELKEDPRTSSAFEADVSKIKTESDLIDLIDKYDNTYYGVDWLVQIRRCRMNQLPFVEFSGMVKF
jgi:hypothetical protein